MAEQKEAFKSIVYDIYNFYSDTHQEVDGDQGSSSKDSHLATETDNVCDLVVSASLRKKRYRGIANDAGSHRGKMSNHHYDLFDEEKQKEKIAYEKGKASQAVDNRAELTDSEGGKEQNGKTNSKSWNKRSLKINDDTEVDDCKGIEEAPRKNNGSKKIPQKMDSNADSNDSHREEEVMKKVLRKTNTFEDKRSHKIDEYELSGVSNGEDQLNEQGDQGNASNHNNCYVYRNEKNIQATKLTKKSKDTTSRSADRMKKLPPQTADSIRLKNLKRFVRTCGLHKNYVKLFSECDTMTQREKTLERILREDTGFEGRITLSMCKMFRRAKEEADELAELDCSNIITAKNGQRPTRKTCTGLDDQLTPLTVLNSDSPKPFRRLKGVVDSDGSDSEEEQRTGKHPLSTYAAKKQYPQENSRKRRKLDSSSDEDCD